MTTDVLIEAKDLQMYFGDIRALDGVNAQIRKGEVVVVIGPSGSGKSTFLRCLNLLDRPTGGKVLFEGTDITNPKVNINIHPPEDGHGVPQFNLFPHMTVLRNLTVAPMKLRKMSRTDAEGRALFLLQKVGLADKVNVYPNTLSGGQQQRVAIAALWPCSRTSCCLTNPLRPWTRK